MPASLESLSPELLDLIVSQLASWIPDSRPCVPALFSPSARASQRLAPYATVLREWQAAVERYTFFAIKESSCNLQELKAMICACPRRRASLKQLFYRIELPLYSENRRFGFEGQREHRWNLTAFRRSLLELWAELATWNEPHISPRGVKLILEAKSTEDLRVNTPLDETIVSCNMRWIYTGHLLSLHDSHNELLALPTVPSVTNLRIGGYSRRIHPTAIGEMLLSLPNLRKLDINIYPTRLRDRDLRTEMRNALARALETSTLGHLESLSLALEESTPANHDYQTAWKTDPDYPNGDHLGRALCRLAQTSLRHLSIIGLISPVLWGVDPAHPDREAKTFPYLEKLSVRFTLHTYDGRWYYTGSQSMDENDDADDEDNNEDGDDVELEDLQRPLHGQTDPDLVSGSSSSDGAEYATHVNWEREKYLDGEYPRNIWRTEPDSKMFDPLIQGFVSATHRMPRLQVAELMTNGPENGEIGLGITYAAPGAKLKSEDWVEEVANLSNPRWIVALGFSSPWMLPDPIPGLMEKQLGADGELIIKRTYYL